MYHTLKLVPFVVPILTCVAKTVTFNWDITWVNAAPDGFNRPVIGINGQWPPPKIAVDVGDTIVVVANNKLGNETTGLHWHGMFQTGTNNMDGPVGVTQCAIPPGSSFTYQFQAYPAGSFWYHSHAPGQYPDGLRGPLIVHDKSWERSLNIADQYVMTLSDWYHDQMPGLVHYYLSNDNADGAEPIPKASLINDKMTETFKIKPNQRYLIRIISMSALAAHYVRFDGHQMQVVAIDGVPVKSTPADTINISAAQRYDVIITGKDKADKNYAFVAAFDPDMFDTVPPDLNMNSDGILQYNSAAAKPSPIRDTTFSNVLDDFGLVPQDQMRLLGKPSPEITFNVNFSSFSVVQRYSNISALGDTPYIKQKVPTLFTALTTGQAATNPKVYGETVNPYVLERGNIVQIIINNLDDGGHPFHLHGHNFQVLSRSNTLPWNGDASGFPKTPMRRDVVKVPGLGSAVLRFKADNPGVYLFHCHIDWHVEAGLSVTFIEAPRELQKQFPRGIPQEQRYLCLKQDVPTAGNCAGNIRDFLDVSKCVQKEQFDANPYGSLIQGRRY